jgi:hypoxanthine phosphoribosyltransferase
MGTPREVVTASRIAARVAGSAAGSRRTTPDRIWCWSASSGRGDVLADLVRAVEGSVRFELVNVDTHPATGGEALGLSYGTHVHLEGAHALVLKDICHSGVTEQYLLTHLSQQGPASLDVVALINRPRMRRVALEPKYVVLPEVPEGILVGYGMEHDGRWGNLPGIHLIES